MGLTDTRLRTLKPPKGKTEQPAGRGRPKGSRDKFSRDFLEAFAADFQEHGVEAIRRTREERPAEYIKIAASILPKEIDVKTPESDLTDEQLEAAYQELLARISRKGAASGETQP